MQDNFNIFIPCDIVKSEETNSDEMRIAGYASTSDKDRQDDEIMQKGLDISDFVNYGFFNFDHDNSKILGYPDKSKTKIDSHGFWVEGTLLQTPLAKSLWDTAVALKKSNAPRKLGFSIEGKTLKRDDLGRIVKAKVYNVALTANPVNPNATWDALVKSFAVDNDENTTEIDKSLEAGYYDSNGSDLIPESLESNKHPKPALTEAFKKMAEVVDDDSEEVKKSLRDALESEELTKSQLVFYYQVTKGLSHNDSASLVNKLLKKEDNSNG